MKARTAAVALNTALPRVGEARFGCVAAVGIAYFAVAMVGLDLASINPSATPIWPATGLAIGTILVWGYGVVPGILAAAFLANLLTAGNVFTSASIAIGNSMEAAVIAHVVQRWCEGRQTFDTPAGVIRFAGIAMTTGTLVSPTVGVLALALGGYVAAADLWPVWMTWWLGDVAGALVVAPVVILWADRREPSLATGSWQARALTFAGAAGVGMIAFSPLVALPFDRGPLAFLAILPLMGAALTRDQKDTSMVALILSAFAVWGTLAGTGPFLHARINDSFLHLLAFMLACSVPSLALSADVAVRRRGEARLRELNASLASREEVLREAQEIAGVGRWEFDIASGRIRWSDEIFRMFGRPLGQGEPSYEDLRRLLHPDDLPTFDAAVRRALTKGGSYEIEWRARRSDGSYRWKQTRARAHCNDRGDVVRLVGTDIDITERKEAERRQSLLVAELNHRVKNSLAAVQAIAQLSLRPGEDPKIFVDAFQGRLMALSQAHDLLTRTGWESAELGALARQVLAPFQRDGPSVVLDGPAVHVRPNSAVALSMGLHELATNAAKYGALSMKEGRVRLRWAIQGAPDAAEVHIHWKEEGGPTVKPPQRTGFGSRLIERGLAHELGGRTKLDFSPSGVECRIRFALGARGALKSPT